MHAAIKRELPAKMERARCMTDANNDKNYFIFGAASDNRCWKYDYNKQKFIAFEYEIYKHQKQVEVWGHNCAYFEIKKTQNSKNIINETQFALIYGGDCHSAYDAIYEINNQIIKNGIELQFKR